MDTVALYVYNREEKAGEAPEEFLLPARAYQEAAGQLQQRGMLVHHIMNSLRQGYTVTLQPLTALEVANSDHYKELLSQRHAARSTGGRDVPIT